MFLYQQKSIQLIHQFYLVYLTENNKLNNLPYLGEASRFVR